MWLSGFLRAKRIKVERVRLRLISWAKINAFHHICIPVLQNANAWNVLRFMHYKQSTKRWSGMSQLYCKRLTYLEKLKICRSAYVICRLDVSSSNGHVFIRWEFTCSDRTKLQLIHCCHFVSTLRRRVGVFSSQQVLCFRVAKTEVHKLGRVVKRAGRYWSGCHYPNYLGRLHIARFLKGLEVFS